MSQKLTLIETTPQTPETPAAGPQTHHHRGVFIVVAAVIALVVLSLLYGHMARTVAVNSDNAGIVLEAADVLHGNVALHGWTLANESFFTLDLPFHLAAVAWHGVSGRVMHDVPAVIYALTVLGAVWLAGRGPQSGSPWPSRAVTFALIGLPSLALPPVMLVGVGHAATALAMVGSLVVLDLQDEHGPTRARWAGLGVLGFLLVVNDPMAVTLFIVPTLLVSAVRHFRHTSGVLANSDRPELYLAVVAGAALILGDVFLKAVQATGGFQVTPLTLRIVPLGALTTNALLLVQGLLSLFRADIFGEIVNTVTACLGINLLALGLALGSMGQVLRGWAGWHTTYDRVSQILAVTMALNLLALLFDKAVFDLYKTLTSPAERYLIPCFIFGAILAGRWGVAQIGNLTARKIFATALVLVAAAQFAAQWQTPPAEDRPILLAHWLAGRGLKYGYGNYWCSSIVTAESGDTVQVRPVEALDGHLSGKHWFSQAQWYHGTPAHFLVYDIAQVGRRAFYFDDVNLQSATATFGPPTETDRMDGYTILIWDKDITPDLRR